VADPRQLEHPVKGWVSPGELIICDCCLRRVFYWELHHLVPIAWGGSDSRLETDRQVVWVRICGDCHGVVHMILDKARHDGGWPLAWLVALEAPHHMIETARRGWNKWKQMTFEGVTT